MAEGKSEIVTFKVDSELYRRLQGVANRSEFIRAAILHALDNVCPLCGGTGVLTVGQKLHWREFERDHSVEECEQCHALRLVCANEPADGGEE